MQIYFGALPIEQAYDTDAMFVAEGDNNNLYYYGVEYGSNPGGFEEVLIYDGLEREVPVDIESVPALIEALKAALKLSKHYAVVDEVANRDISVGVTITKE